MRFENQECKACGFFHGRHASTCPEWENAAIAAARHVIAVDHAESECGKALYIPDSDERQRRRTAMGMSLICAGEELKRDDTLHLARAFLRLKEMWP